MANELIPTAEIAAHLYASIQAALMELRTDEERKAFLDALAHSFFYMPMEMGEVRATDRVDATAPTESKPEAP